MLLAAEVLTVTVDEFFCKEVSASCWTLKANHGCMPAKNGHEGKHEREGNGRCQRVAGRWTLDALRRTWKRTVDVFTTEASATSDFPSSDVRHVMQVGAM